MNRITRHKRTYALSIGLLALVLGTGGIVFAGGWSRSPFSSDWGWPTGLRREDEKEYERLQQLVRTADTPPGMVEEAKEKLAAWDEDIASMAEPVLDDTIATTSHS